jgi:hypothetical protein
MPLKCDPARKIVDDSGFPRTPDRLLKFCGTRVQWLEVFKTITSTCGLYYLGGSATVTCAQSQDLCSVCVLGINIRDTRRKGANGYEH